jgi:hypothetical protein
MLTKVGKKQITAAMTIFGAMQQLAIVSPKACGQPPAESGQASQDSRHCLAGLRNRGPFPARDPVRELLLERVRATRIANLAA